MDRFKALQEELQARATMLELEIGRLQAELASARSQLAQLEDYQQYLRDTLNKD